MSLVNNLDTTTSNVNNVISQSQPAVDSSNEQNSFGTILESLSSGADTISTSLTSLTNFDILPIDSFQSKLLLETGLSDANLLSLNVSDDMISQMQQELLSSLQTSMIKNTAVMSPSSTTESAESSEGITTTPLVDGISDSSVLDDIYTFTFGEDGLDQNDFFDSINVLNHIPIVSDIYQISTDTDISPVSKLVGSMLYSGAIGVGVTAVEMGLNYLTGYNTKDIVADTGLLLSLTDEQDDS
ncbi:hypothetical protein [Shewanella polaris]|uniref:Uncharacterized protein n=1 Tax=Shewanella polaris TaxID=2588449 RepID=A0A4Y5YAL0_9GAMM|nr:hypothetical protein [Shewanella polaris]QDE29629.1 hypothetical protein FH971_00805 [Shewanella polaris]